MCGRFALTATPEEIEELFGLMDLEPFPPRFNIAPTQPILVVAGGAPRGDGSNQPIRRALLVRWGLVPGWAKDPRDLPLLINARSETAAQKNAFSAAMRYRRVLVPASGFYEWRRRGAKTSQPYWLRPAGGRTVAFGGLMETWSEPGGSELDSGAILTTAANAQVAQIHDRMPVVIRPEDFERWTNCRDFGPGDVADLLAPVEPGYFEAVPVSDKVNKPANTGPEIQDPVEPAPQGDDPSRVAKKGSPKKKASGDDRQLKLF